MDVLNEHFRNTNIFRQLENLQQKDKVTNEEYHWIDMAVGQAMEAANNN